MSRYASLWNKRDQSEKPILQAIAKLGVEWIEAGPLDGWVYITSRWLPVEIKTGNAPLTEGQQKFLANCIEAGRPCVIWRSAAEAVESVQSWRQRA